MSTNLLFRYDEMFVGLSYAAEISKTFKYRKKKESAKKININAIGLSNPERLANGITYDMATKILFDRDLNGDFKDYHDLQNRIHGLGSMKVEALRNSGFLIAASNRLDTKAIDSSVRKSNVNEFKHQTWWYRKRIDMYTGKTAEYFQKHRIKEEVDHLLECQIVDFANKKVGESLGPASGFSTRGTQDVVRSLFNGVSNLNVTSHDVNQKKKGPFMSFCSALEKGGVVRTLEDFLPNSKAKALVDDGTWKNIIVGMTKAHDEIEKNVENIINNAQKCHAELILAEVRSMMTDMGVD